MAQSTEVVNQNLKCFELKLLLKVIFYALSTDLNEILYLLPFSRSSECKEAIF